MVNVFTKITQKLSKPILFGVYGALGCFLAAIVLGQPFLEFTKLPPSIEQNNHAIVLLIDSSGSMGDGKLEEVKSAALDFVQRQDLSRNKLGVVNFGFSVDNLSSLTSDRETLETAIRNLVSSGGTPMAQGINLAANQLRFSPLQQNILLFTDGQPNSTFQANLEAQAARSQNINIVAVATGDADTRYLTRLTGDSSLVFFANSGEFDQAFRDAETKIFSRQLTESQDSGDYGLVYGSLRTGGWTATLAVGISLALIIGQNKYMRRRFLSWQEAGISIVGGLVAGLIAGGVGQLLFSPVAILPNTGIVQGILNWTILGSSLAGLVALFKSHLGIGRCITIGAIGGTLAGAITLLSINFWGALPAQLIGALVLGITFGTITKSKAFGGLITIGAIFLNQWLLLAIPGLPPVTDILGRILGWTILGVLVGSGTSFFVPNLKLNRALVGGSLGGSLGAIGFLIAAALLGDISARLIGAGIMGFCIGLMIAWAEEKQLNTEDYLVVHWTPKEQTKILLGTRPVMLGSSYEAQIPLSKGQGFYPVTAKIFKEGKQIIMQYDEKYAQDKGMKIVRHQLKNGDRRKLGQITIEVKNSLKQELSKV